MDLPNPQTAAAHLKKFSPLRPPLAIVLGSGFHHALEFRFILVRLRA